MNSEFLLALEEIAKEKNISKEMLIETIEAALITAYKRNYNTSMSNVVVNIDRETGSVKVFIQKEVVEEVETPLAQISLDEARTISGKYEIGDVVAIEDTPAAFGRIAAQTAKQVVMQRIREAERGQVYEEFSAKDHEMLDGVIERVEKKNIYLDVGRTEAFLPVSEQVPTERYAFHQRLKVFVTEVRNTTKGPQVTVSRTRPALVSKLFEQEIPEIAQGVVEIRSIAREPGSRTKVAVISNDASVDPIGACIGNRGLRVQNVVDELRGEKIDIVCFSDDPATFIKNALNPAEVVDITVDEEKRMASVIVPYAQLSLAIGKEGQNARLAARLTGYKIDIKPDRAPEN
ncbi:MAG: transcription termination/antitermination protein NusA [Ruminococcaceae bacterium]|nr:transcription termination/antitermination protein NusA [Oscillospiraceae bacterium]